MTPSPELYAQLRKLLNEEERRQLDEANKRIRTLTNRVRQLTTQRDNAIGRGAELRAHIARYQANLAELKKEKRDE